MEMINNLVTIYFATVDWFYNNSQGQLAFWVCIVLFVYGLFQSFSFITDQLETDIGPVVFFKRIVASIIFDIWYCLGIALSFKIGKIEELFHGNFGSFRIWLAVYAGLWALILFIKIKYHTTPEILFLIAIYMYLPISLIFLTFHTDISFSLDRFTRENSKKIKDEEPASDSGSDYRYSYEKAAKEARAHADSQSNQTGCSDSQNKNYFTGVFSAEELKRRYKTLAKKLHPDVNGGDSREFKKMQSEYNNIKKTMCL